MDDSYFLVRLTPLLCLSWYLVDGLSFIKYRPDRTGQEGRAGKKRESLNEREIAGGHWRIWNTYSIHLKCDLLQHQCGLLGRDTWVRCHCLQKTQQLYLRIYPICLTFIWLIQFTFGQCTQLEELSFSPNNSGVLLWPSLVVSYSMSSTPPHHPGEIYPHHTDFQGLTSAYPRDILSILTSTFKHLVCTYEIAGLRTCCTLSLKGKSVSEISMKMSLEWTI